MFDSKRKLTRVKIHPVGDYLFDKHIGISRKCTISETLSFNEYKIIFNLYNYDNNYFYDEKCLKLYSEILKNLKKYQKISRRYSAYVRIDYYTTEIAIELTIPEYEAIKKSTDYDDWYNDIKKKSEKFKIDRELKKATKKYNL